MRWDESVSTVSVGCGATPTPPAGATVSWAQAKTRLAQYPLLAGTVITDPADCEDAGGRPPSRSGLPLTCIQANFLHTGESLRELGDVFFFFQNLVILHQEICTKTSVWNTN